MAKNLLKVGGLFKQQINWMRRSVAEGVWIMRIMITLMDKGFLKERHVHVRAHAQPPGIEQRDGIRFSRSPPRSLNSSRLIRAHHQGRHQS